MEILKVNVYLEVHRTVPFKSFNLKALQFRSQIRKRELDCQLL